MKSKLRGKNINIYKGKEERKNPEENWLIFTYNTGNPPIHQWIREAKNSLVRTDEAKCPGRNIQITSKQPKNL